MSQDEATLDDAADQRVDRWEEASFWPLTGISMVFLVAYAWPILDRDLPAPWPAAMLAVTWVTWGVFVVDYVARLLLTRPRRRLRFVRRNPLDLAVVLLPVLRPLQLLRALSVLNRAAGSSLRGKVAAYVVGSTTLVLLVASLAVLDAERGTPDANITGFGEAVWWSFTTVTTVGYGDQFPVTGSGRLVAIGLMVAGIALAGVVTASLASWLLDRVEEVSEESRAATRRDVELLSAEIRALREELRASRE